MSSPSLLACFDSSVQLLAATRALRERGFQALDALTPYPVEGLPQALGLSRSRLPILAFAGAVAGAGAIVALQYYSVLIDYPINVGGRPLGSWPAFLIPGFECAILGAALVAFFGMLAGNGLPRYHHPVFDAESFTLATGDRFYLVVDADDPHYDRASVRRVLRRFKATSVEEVGN